MSKSLLAGTVCFILAIVLPVGALASCSSSDPRTIGTTEARIQQNVYLQEENVGGMTEAQALQKVREHALDVDIEPKDAILDPETWEITGKEQDGRRVNAEKTLQQLLGAGEGERIPLVMETIKPRITAASLQKNIKKLAGFSTPLVDRATPRVNNIDIAAEKMDFLRLAPGEEFSFNRTTGRRTEAKGYEEAPIIIRTKHGPKKGKGVGGGVCQLASTLYNAVEEAGLEVTERHEHSKDVPYVADGMDATVSYGSVDFRFRNSRTYPVMIRTYLRDEKLIVRIYENRNR